jgi:hypothetical protein
MQWLLEVCDILFRRQLEAAEFAGSALVRTEAAILQDVNAVGLAQTPGMRDKRKPPLAGQPATRPGQGIEIDLAPLHMEDNVAVVYNVGASNCTRVNAAYCFSIVDRFVRCR